MKTLYVSDLDGTLLGPDSSVSAGSRDKLNEAIAEGALFTVATARTPATVSSLLREINLPLPAIVMTGAALWDQKTGEYSEVKFIDPATVRAMKEIYGRLGLGTFIYTLREGRIHIYHPGPLTPLETDFIRDRRDNPYKFFHEDQLPEGDDNVLLFYAMRPPSEVRPVYEELRGLPGCNPVYYFDMFGPDTAIMEVFSREVSKAEAMKSVACRAGAGRVVAFGDNVNDLAMLLAADHGVAVENAIAEVREAADEVTGPNTDDSVASYVARDFRRSNNPQ